MTGHLVVSYHTCPMEEPGTGLAGGMNVFLRGLLRGLSRRGFPTDVLTRAAGVVAEISSPFPAVRILHVPCGWVTPPTRRSAFESLERFVDGSLRLMREHRVAPRVVSAHYWMSGLSARRFTDAPMVLVYHTVEARKPGAGPADPLSEVRRREEERLASEAARVVCLSEYDLAETGKAIPFVTGKGVVIPPGVDERFRRLPPRKVARAYLGLPTDADVLLVAARGDGGKNTAAAVGAFRTVRERGERTLILVVAGQGGPADDGDGIVFLPSVPHDAMPMLYAAADAVICPSRYESFGLVPLEALASGIPVAVPQGTYWGGKIGSEGGGIAYDPDDPDGLSGAMRSLLSDPELRTRLSREGARVASTFTWERCTESWGRLLSSVSTTRSPR